jgi:hypothetical protein
MSLMPAASLPRAPADPVGMRAVTSPAPMRSTTSLASSSGPVTPRAMVRASQPPSTDPSNAIMMPMAISRSVFALTSRSDISTTT